MRKAIHFRKVQWFGDTEDTPHLLREALAARPELADTHFLIGGEHCEIRHRGEQGGDILLHFATYIPGARRGTTPHAGAHNGDLGDAIAPAGTDFSEREIAVVVRGAQVGFSSLGHVQSGFVERSLRGILALQFGQNLADRFFLTAKADEDALAQLIDEGVSFLDLGLSLPHVEAVEHIEAQPLDLGGRISNAITNALSARLAADHDEDKLVALSNANARLALKFRKNAPLAQIQSLTALAKHAVEDDEEFRLETVRGNTFSRESLLVKGHYNQPGATHVLNYVLAWEKIRAFLDGVDG